jgi:hypothetical protein
MPCPLSGGPAPGGGRVWRACAPSARAAAALSAPGAAHSASARFFQQRMVMDRAADGAPGRARSERAGGDRNVCNGGRRFAMEDREPSPQLNLLVALMVDLRNGR